MDLGRVVLHLGGRTALGSLAFACAACALPTAPDGPSDGPSDGANATQGPAFALAAYDARATPVALYELPRRPQFVLSSTRPLEPVELLLFEGGADAELRDDLAALPLRAAHDVRLVRSRVSQSGAVLRLAPVAALSRGGTYTLALPGQARVRDGRALQDAGPAFETTLQVAGDATAGATWVASAPAAGALGVPPNMRAAFVALDGAVDGVAAGIWLEGPDGLSVPADVRALDCDEVDVRATTCLQLAVEGQLQPDQRYALRSGRALRDAHGTAIEPLLAAFTTGSASDAQPPEFEPLTCAEDEVVAAFGCALVSDSEVQLRMRLGENVRVLAHSGGRSAAQLSAAGDVELRLGDLPVDALFELAVSATDLAGNTSTQYLLLRTQSELARVSISEVRADPKGAEPAQEYVEIHNFGARATALQGITLADASGERPNTIGAAVELAANARALLVADDFDPAAGLDAVVPAGVRLIRVGARITTGGLANSGEALFLRDAAGRRLSAVPRLPAVAGSCLQRIGGDPRSGAPAEFGMAACTPGR